MTLLNEFGDDHIGLASDSDSKPKCKGQFFRYVEQSYATKRGGWKFHQELVPLKRMSCQNDCPDCYAMLDYIRELDGPAIHGGVQSGDIVKLKWHSISTYWETDSEVHAVKYVEEQ